MAFTPRTVCTSYIVSTPEKVWEGLTAEQYTKQYFFGRRIVSDWKVGSPITYYMENGEVDIRGKIVECDKPYILSLTWRAEGLEEYRKLPEALVTFRIDPLGGLVRLTATEAHDWDISEALLMGGRKGWPVILNGLKTLMETGKPMPLADFPV